MNVAVIWRHRCLLLCTLTMSYVLCIVVLHYLTWFLRPTAALRHRLWWFIHVLFCVVRIWLFWLAAWPATHTCVVGTVSWLRTSTVQLLTSLTDNCSFFIRCKARKLYDTSMDCSIGKLKRRIAAEYSGTLFHYGLVHIFPFVYYLPVILVEFQ